MYIVGEKKKCNDRINDLIVTGKFIKYIIFDHPSPSSPVHVFFNKKILIFVLCRNDIPDTGLRIDKFI
jgi:hypothetical protein